MAVTNKTAGNEREKVQYKWGNSGPNYWQKEQNTVLQSFLRKSDKNNYEFCLRIQSLDDDGKFVKNEDGTYDNGYFNFSSIEVAKVAYQLEQMFPTSNLNEGTIGGIIINHISAKTNNGSQFEIVNEEGGTYVYISYVQNAEITSEYKHLLSNDQTLRFYNDEGEEAEEVINMDIVSFKTLFNSAYALVSGLVDSAFECNDINVNGRSESKTGGRVAGGMNRKVRPTLASKRAESVSEDDEEDVSSSKKSVGRKAVSNIAKSASNMKSLLEDDDEEDD